MINVTVDSRDAARKLARISEELPPALASRTLRVAEYIAGVIRKHVPKGRTGALMRSYRATMLTTKGSGMYSAGAMSDLVYARIRNEGTGYLPGGVLKAKTVKNLAIPLSDKAKRTVGLWPRDWPSGRLFLVKKRDGRLFLAERLSRRRIIFHYKLQPTVKQEGSRYIEASLPESVRIAREELGQAVKIAVRTGGR